MLETMSAYGWYRDCGTTGETKPAGTGCTARRMPYWQYKRQYSDCETVAGSYDKNEKTIEVYIPNERIKPSGMRDQRVGSFMFWFSVDSDVFSTYYKAVNKNNAAKRFKADCKKYHWEPVERVTDCREYDRYAICLPAAVTDKVFKYAPELNPFK